MDFLVQAIIAVLVIHFVADFIFQSGWMANGKAHSVIPLTVHVLVYTGTFAVIAALYLYHPLLISYVDPSYVMPFTLPVIDQKSFIWFVCLNGILHFIVDFFTSKVSSSCFARNDYRHGFMTVGFDQLLHQITLVVTTYAFLVR